MPAFNLSDYPKPSGGKSRTHMSQVHLTILGSGSIGLALAATYVHAGANVTILGRGTGRAQLKQSGIQVTGVAGEHFIEPNRLKVSDVAAADPEDLMCDVLIVATKAYQVKAALEDLVKQQGANFAPKMVLLLQNGWGSGDEVRTILPAHIPIFSGIMMIGIERRTPTHINVNVLAGPVRLGSLFKADAAPMKRVVEIGGKGFLPIDYDENIEPTILNKFLFNSCLNALGALTNMSYGELVTNPHTRHLIENVADEIIKVVQMERNYSLAASGAEYVEKTLLPFVIPKAAAHRSSMLQDVEAGRKTEIDYLNGATVRIGRTFGIATPCNDVVSNLIRATDKSSPR